MMTQILTCPTSCCSFGASAHDFFPEFLGGAAEETKNSSQANLDNDGVKGSEGTPSLHVDGSREAGPSGNRLRRSRPRVTRGG